TTDSTETTKADDQQSVQSVVPSASGGGEGQPISSEGLPIIPSHSLDGDVLSKLIGLVSAKTGYPKDLLDPNLDMEADLGIDTVKQAELFGEVRATYNIPLVEGLLIKDYPTLRKVAQFVLANTATPVPSLAPAATQESN